MTSPDLEAVYKKLDNDTNTDGREVRLFFTEVLEFRNTVLSLTRPTQDSTDPTDHPAEVLEKWALLARDACYLKFPIPDEDDDTLVETHKESTN